MPSWIVEYAKAITPMSESPKHFNVWAAISLLGSVLKRNVYMNYKTFTIYPNSYIVFVAPPGVGKGTAMHPAHEFAKTLGLANYLSDRITAPRILELINAGFAGAISLNGHGQLATSGKDSTVTLMSSELPTLLTASDWMLQFLCDAWDRGSFDYETRNRGAFTIKDMGVSLVGACVPEYIRKLSKDSISSVSSGFSSRTIFVGADRSSQRIPWTKGFRNNPTLAPVILSLENALRDIAKISGEVKLDQFAMDLWEKWYVSLDTQEGDSDVLKNFRARQDVHVLKTAMILAASDSSPGSNPLLINRITLEKAIWLIGDIAAGIDEIFRGVGESAIASGLARLQIYIEKKGQVITNELVRDNMKFVDPIDIERILKVLEMTRFINVRDLGKGVYLIEHTGQPISRLKSSGKSII